MFFLPGSAEGNECPGPSGNELAWACNNGSNRALFEAKVRFSFPLSLIARCHLAALPRVFMAEKKGSSSEKVLYCSFCGKSQHEVKKLIAGPSVFICDECIELCNDIIRD